MSQDLTLNKNKAKQDALKNSEILYMVTCVFSPSQYKSRYNRYFQFAEYIAKFKNVKLYTVELIIGDQEFTVTDPHNPHHLQLRTEVPLWYKENILNILINSLPPEAKKIAWVDCDVQWDNPNWARDTLRLLNRFPVVQMFSTWQNLDENDKPTHPPGRGFAHRWVHKTQEPGNNGFTGLAWAARRDVLNNLGGLIDWGILGSGDYYMANAFVGRNRSDAGQIDVNKEPGLSDFVEHLDGALNVWIAKAKKHVNGKIAYVNSNIRHFFHGKKSERGYDWRWNILYKYDHRPLVDLRYKENGLIYVKNPKDGFFKDVQHYFDSRSEDFGLPKTAQKESTVEKVNLSIAAE